MSKKFLSTLLTLVTLLAAAPSRVSAAREMTDEEEREARSLAVSFVKRLREADDFGPPVAEFFPEDFEQRVKQFIREMPEDVKEDLKEFPCDRALLLRAEDGDLRRGYVAMMNFWNQQDRLRRAAWGYIVVEYRAEGKDALEEYQAAWTRHEAVAEKAVPEEAFRIAASDPLVDAMFRLIRADDDGDADTGDERPEEEMKEDRAKFEAAYIRDAARLRSFVEKLERCVALLREGVSKLRSDAKSLAASHGVAETPAERDDLKVYSLEEQTLEAAAFGMPSGALLIQARIYPFEMAMTRVEGKLKIVAAYPDVDGD